MLVLTRRNKEDIIVEIAKDRFLTLRVIAIRGNQVQLGVGAGADIPVHRKEVADLVYANNPDYRRHRKDMDPIS